MTVDFIINSDHKNPSTMALYVTISDISIRH
jgi:hypothetical protein